MNNFLFPSVFSLLISCNDASNKKVSQEENRYRPLLRNAFDQDAVLAGKKGYSLANNIDLVNIKVPGLNLKTFLLVKPLISMQDVENKDFLRTIKIQIRKSL